MEEQPVKMYFKGGAGIERPVDVDGKAIKEGDVLTFNVFDPFYSSESYKQMHPAGYASLEKRKSEPVFVVKRNPKGFFYGLGIKQDLYLHDFCFKYTRIINP